MLLSYIPGRVEALPDMVKVRMVGEKVAEVEVTGKLRVVPMR